MITEYFFNYSVNYKLPYERFLKPYTLIEISFLKFPFLWPRHFVESNTERNNFDKLENAQFI